MIASFFLLLLVSSAFCTKVEINDKCINDEDYTLQKEILLHRNNATNPCTDPFNYMCSEDTRKKSLEDNLSYMKTYLIDILNKPLTNGDSELLKVEKTLYQSCIQSDYIINQDEADVRPLITELRNLKTIAKWQDVENKLFSSGFGYSFFNMKVISHPEYESVNTIMLQPPSLKSIRSMMTRFNKILDYKRQYQRKQHFAKAEAVQNLYEFVDEGTEAKILQFFNMLAQAKLGKSVYTADFPENYTSIKQFNGMRFHAYSKPDLSIKADWAQMIHESLKKININFDTDNIVLKNPKYFLDLAMLLRDTPNNIIVSAIQVKSITENLAYLDWELYNLLEATDRSKFCFEETKLYGASRMLIHDWVNENDARFSCYMKGENIISNIISSIRNEISSYNKSSWKSVFYKRKLFYVFENLRKYVYEPPYNLYGSLNVSSGTYFKNIIDYRKMVIRQELEYLQDKYDVSRPFSFIDQDEPQNRFVISTLINIAEMFSPDLPKEVHFGTFGVKTAALIHALLQEDTYNDESTMTNNDKLIYPKYSDATKYCIMNKLHIYNFVNNLNDIISQSLALGTALDALGEDGYVSPHSITNSLLYNEKITKEKLFFLAYIKDNCHLNKEVLNSILIGDYLFDTAFNCQVNVQDSKTCMLGPPNFDSL